jgi:methylenetetrahydrofolate--tRNA-(uracil-5-)-methyltransferase
VQLRQDDAAGSLYNLVGFQTNLAWAEQETVLRLIPGLERAEFVRLGQMHRNTYLNSPRLVRQSLQWHDRDDLLVAGQLTGTEGYVGSTASGLIAGINAAHLALGRPVFIPPRNSLVGALLHYITHADPDTFQPMKANFGLLEPLDPPVNHRRDRHAGFGQRALDELAEALVGSAVTIPP